MLMFRVCGELGEASAFSESVGSAFGVSFFLSCSMVVTAFQTENILDVSV